MPIVNIKSAAAAERQAREAQLAEVFTLCTGEMVTAAETFTFNKTIPIEDSTVIELRPHGGVALQFPNGDRLTIEVSDLGRVILERGANSRA